ncbi:MAG: hypothetical protein IPI06_15390 [Gammaproteobacteria bacterium]|nr:hypothetical protein [Gammaproteobacteria bacterium]
MTRSRRGRGKNPATPEAQKFPRRSVSLEVREGASEEEIAGQRTQLVTSPELAAYRVLQASEGEAVVRAQIDVPSLLSQLRAQAAAVNRGDLTHPEAMLMNQADALQSLFCRLTERAMAAEFMAPFEAFMRMALRAQSQCRATLETLATIKNPPTVIVRQANIAHGPQQVNNGLATPSRAREAETVPSELLEHTHGERLDTGAAAACRSNDPSMAAVEALDRPDDRRG